MEALAIAVPLAAFAAFIGYKVGYSKGVKVNAPVPAPKPKTPYDPDRDLRK
jgi:hypothetical protein